MKYTLDIKETAKVGLFEAFDYYENKQEGLGDKFLDDWETHLNIIKQNPLLFQKKYKDFRQLLIKPYPYHIIYEVEENLITVYKVIYAGRNPTRRYIKK
jgi:plasmid stabilization system protein ParE